MKKSSPKAFRLNQDINSRLVRAQRETSLTESAIVDAAIDRFFQQYVSAADVRKAVQQRQTALLEQFLEA